MSRLRVISTLLLLFATALPAAASEQSELLYSRGLVLFHQGKYTEALGLFDQAVAADPQDLYARYYRGVTQGRLENYPAAVADLREVLKTKPDFVQGALELGTALIETGEAAAAVPYLEQAQRAPALEAEASLLLGVAQIRVGEPAQALLNFERAAADPDLKIPATFYKGVASYQEAKWSEAEGYFAAVAAESPDSEMGREATAYLTTLRQADHSTVGTRRYRLYGNVGLQYDSNVGLLPNDGAQSNVKENSFDITSGQADGRAVIEVGGLFVPWQTETYELSVGYEFFQSLQFRLTQFNLMDNRPNAQFAATFEHLRVGLYTSYDYYMLETSSLMQMVTAMPWAIVPEGDFGRTEISYRFRYRDFYGSHFGIPFDELFTSYNNQPGARQFFYLGDPRRYVMLGYRYDNWDASNTNGEAFSFNGNEVSTALGWALPWDVTSEVGFAYEYEAYNPASQFFEPPVGGYPGRRYDNQYQVVAGADKPLNDYLSVNLSYYGIFNDSNQDPYSYTRNIVSLTLGVRF